MTNANQCGYFKSLHLTSTTVSLHNTCKNCGWHPPLIPWSYLLSHMSKILKTCYPLSRGGRNQKISHSNVPMFILTHHPQMCQHTLEIKSHLSQKEGISCKQQSQLNQTVMNRKLCGAQLCSIVSQTGVNSPLNPRISEQNDSLQQSSQRN